MTHDIQNVSPLPKGEGQGEGQASSLTQGRPIPRHGRTIATRYKAFILSAAILSLCFAQSLFALIRYAYKSDLYSYILLVPAISAYLIYIKRATLDLTDRTNARGAFVPMVLGAAAIAGFKFATAQGWSPARLDYLSVMTLSYLLFLLGLAFIFFPAAALRALTFPIAFAFFTVPLPEIVQHLVETFLQRGSAEVAAAMLSLSGMPLVQDGTAFQLPGFRMEVAPECSGIHSSMVLVMTSLVAGYLFLKSNWRRSVLALAVVPLALLRNGFRIFTIAQLCVRISPNMIDSPIHRRGGPIFFALSMIPFLLLLLFLRKREQHKLT